MRAREPDHIGHVERNGVRVGYEVFGDGDPTIVLLTSWAIVHMRQWKAQVPYLSRHFRVITVEGRGNGRADRPESADAYTDREYVDDAIAIMDTTGTDRAVLVGLSLGGRHALQLAAWYPGRAAGVVAIGTALPWPLPPDFDEPRDSYDGWAKANRHYWLADYRGWVEFFMSQVFTEPHSIKPREDGVGWGLETDAATLLRTVPAVGRVTTSEAEETCRAGALPRPGGARRRGRSCAVRDGRGTRGVDRRRAGDDPRRRPRPADARARPDQSPDPRLRRTDLPEGKARASLAPRPRPRAPGAVRLLADRPGPRPSRPGDRRRAAASCTPTCEIDWLTQEPVSRVLAERGERVHPASRWLASESAHIESEAGEHDVAVFEAVRQMDEILVANFMVFADLVDDEPYDLWIVDEGWEVDHFLFDNPELKRTAYAWLTDFVGWLPMPDGGAAEAALTADWNAERVERMRRYPRLRDRSLFVGNPSDLVDTPLGPDLPTVREWATERYDFSGLRHRQRACSRPRGVAGRARLPARRADLPGHGRRLGGGHPPAAPSRAGLPVGRERGARPADGRGRRSSDRSRVDLRAGRGGRPRLRARSAPPPRRL